MAGADTWRGIAFQAALTTSRAMDVVEGQLGVWLDVDAGAEAIDYASGTEDGPVLIGQAKTRAETYDWPPSDLAPVIRRLVAEAPGGEARIEFVTDGELSPESAAKFVPALERAGAGEASDEDWEYLARHGLTRHVAAALARVTVMRRFDSPSALLDNAVRRLRALADLTGRISDDEAELRVRRLATRIEECGSDADDASSRITRDDIAGMLGLDVGVVDAATPWSEGVADEYGTKLLALPAMEDLVELRAQQQALMPTVSRVASLTEVDPLGDPSHEPVLSLLDRDCMIVGPAGAGKTRSMEMLRRRAVEVGLVPVLLTPRTYASGALPGAVRGAVSRVLGRAVAPATGEQLLSSQETVLIIDGVSELAESQMRTALARDLAEFKNRLEQPTVIISGRSVGGLRPLDLPAYRLRELDRELRQELAKVRSGDAADAVVAHLEQSLGGAVGNPLLFTMGLDLIATGEDVSSIASVYAGFVDRLARNVQDAGDIGPALGVAGIACAEMVAEERFSLDRWSWLTKLETATALLAGRGLIETDVTAVGVLERLGAIGLFVADEDLSGYSLWHDSFRDWLAAKAIGDGLITCPTQLTRPWATVAGHLAEAGHSEVEFLRGCAADLIVCATAAEREAATAADIAEDATLIFRELARQHLAPAVAADLDQGHVETKQTESGVSAYLIPSGAEGITDALAGVEFSYDAGPLRVAASLFETVLRPMVESRTGRPRPIPRDAPALARAIERYFVERRAEMRRLLQATVPTLAEAVEDHLGWRGMRGTISPRTVEDGRSDGYSLEYTHDADDVRVEVSEHSVRGQQSWTSAEDYLREPSEGAASAAVVGALTQLLPGFGRI